MKLLIICSHNAVMHTLDQQDVVLTHHYLVCTCQSPGPRILSTSESFFPNYFIHLSTIYFERQQVDA